jgi:hypothetical protein
LANGASRGWDISVDESLDRDEWTIEIDGPKAYLAFQLQDLTVIPAVLRLLRLGLALRQSRDWHGGRDTEPALTLGRFGSASVSLAWDDEGVRCFIIIGPNGPSTFRLSLDAEDITMFIEALLQVVGDLPAKAGE